MCTSKYTLMSYDPEIEHTKRSQIDAIHSSAKLGVICDFVNNTVLSRALHKIVSNGVCECGCIVSFDIVHQFARQIRIFFFSLSLHLSLFCSHNAQLWRLTVVEWVTACTTSLNLSCSSWFLSIPCHCWILFANKNLNWLFKWARSP